VSRHRARVITNRPVRVERVPDGTPFELPAGTLGQITQALGSHFTLHVDGMLVRLAGTDADAIGQPVPQDPAAAGGEEDAPADLGERIVRVLKTCYDPEIPVDIVELGLVYGCELSPLPEGLTRVDVQMTLTAPGCGMGSILANEVADKLRALPGVGDVDVLMVFDPPWDRSRMSEAALLALGM
jgi:probable FeS assembly SUF system protein SufT